MASATPAKERILSNYGEEWAYWYLRLNGFFPLTNFVVHKDEVLKHRADVDLLAVRPPHVFEQVGGQIDDWDPLLRESFDLSRTLGLICEVKTGGFNDQTLFREDITDRAMKRLGLLPLNEVDAVIDQLQSNAVVQAGSASFAKVLFTTDPHPDHRYLNVTLDQIEAFVEARVRRYPNEKYMSRMFFPSHLFQDVIRRVHRETYGVLD